MVGAGVSQAVGPGQKPRPSRNAFRVQRTMLGLLLGAPMVVIFFYTFTHPFGEIAFVPVLLYGALCIVAAINLLSLPELREPLLQEPGHRPLEHKSGAVPKLRRCLTCDRGPRRLKRCAKVGLSPVLGVVDARQLVLMEL